MPLLTLARTAFDSEKDEKLRINIRESILSFLTNDTIYFRNTDIEKLHKRQKDKLDPLVSYINEKFSLQMKSLQGAD